MTVKASLHWTERANGPSAMTPYVALADAEAMLARVQAAGTAHAAWLEFAHFPRYIDAVVRGLLREEGWEGVQARRRNGTPGDTAEIRRGGEPVAAARFITAEPRTEPFWEARADGEWHRAGCLDGLVLALRNATAPRAIAA